MSLEDIRNAAEKDQKAAAENEGLLAESAGVGGQEIGPEANSHPIDENHAPAAAASEGGEQHHDNNVVDMHGKPLANDEDKLPTRKMARYVGGLSRQLNIDPPEGYEKSFKACRAFLDQHAYVIGEYKKQRQAAKQAAKEQPDIESDGNVRNHGEQAASADDITGSQMDAQTQSGVSPGNQQPQQPTGQASGVGAAIGAIAGLGAGILGLSGSMVKFPVKAGKLGLQTFRNANMQNALEDAQEAAGHFTETVSKLMSGNATQDDVKTAYSEFQKHYKHTLNSIDRVGLEALEKAPERLSDVRQKLNTISERVEAGGLSKLEEDSRFKELGNNLREAFENVCKFFENLFNRILGRSSAAPSMV